MQAANTKAETDALVSTSIGIAICPDDATDRNALLTHADTALYRAKNDGRGVYRFFEAAMGAAALDRRMLKHDLRRAISRDEQKLVYQPEQDIRNGQVIGFEALLRWSHPTRGQVLPDAFIPLAEETGLIFQIGEWVLRAACREAATWDEPITIAINVSSRQIHAETFANTLHDVLFETGLAPARLELEITETALIRDLNRTLYAALDQGARRAHRDGRFRYRLFVALNLLAFPFDKIKIDRSFIKSVHTNDQAATIVRAVLGLGRGLVCRCWPRALRPMPSCNSCKKSSATRRKAIPRKAGRH